MKRILINGFKEILILAFIFILGALITLGLSWAFKEYAGVFIRLFSLVFMSYLTLKLLVLASWILRKDEVRRIKKYTKQPGSRSQTLFEWIGKSDVDEVLFFETLNFDVKSNALENLREIKIKISNKVGPKINDYVMLRSYIELYEKNSLLIKTGTILSGIIIGVVTSSLTKITSSENFLDLIKINYNQNVIGNLNIFLDILSYVAIILLLIIFVMHETTKQKRRNEFLKMILDSIIKDKEKN